MRHENLVLLTFIIVYLSLTGLNAQTIKDFEGNVGKTVTIGKQVWLAENLNTGHYQNGDLISEAKTATEWAECNKKRKVLGAIITMTPQMAKSMGSFITGMQ